MTRKPIDNWYWELLLEACGNKCGCCGKHQSELRQPLQRGHIKLHSVGGEVDPENIMPVCLPCNNAYKKSDTPFTHLPTDYLARLAVLLLRRINPKYRVYAFSARVDTILANESDENKELVRLQNGDLGLRKALYVRSRQLDPHAAQRAVDKLISESQNHPHPPVFPNAGHQTTMRELVRDHGPEIFLAVGGEWIRKEKWISDDNRYVHDPWSQFIHGFKFLLQDLRLAAKRAEEQRKQCAEEIERQRDDPKVWELVYEKTKLHDIVRQCKLLAEGLGGVNRNETMATIRIISDWIDEQNSVESLTKESHKVYDLYEDLTATSPESLEEKESVAE